MWERQRPALAPRRVVAVEHPGHGGAPVAEVRAVRDLAARVLDEVDDDTFSLVGVSLGGAVGLQLAIDAPERVRRLVLACTSARFGEPRQWIDRAATVRAEGVGAIADAVLDRWFTPAFEEREPFAEMLLSTDPEGYARCCEALARWDAREELPRVEAPTLVVSGADDPSTPPEHGALIAARVAAGQHVVIDSAAHLANVERAEQFNRLLEDHL
jgi:3-oxoadipate enol-lactonase